jgi:hypothetical protein
MGGATVAPVPPRRRAAGGAEAVADSWLAERDEPGSWEAEYVPALISGQEAIATGETRYTDGEVFSNLWQLEFAPDGRCSRFVEWYLRHPAV